MTTETITTPVSPIIDMRNLNMSKAQLARLLNVSRTYVTLLTQGKRQPSKELVDKLANWQLTPHVRSQLTGGMQTAYFKSVEGHEYVSGGFDPHTLPPKNFTPLLTYL